MTAKSMTESFGWNQRLNRYATSFEIEGSRCEVYHWAHQEHLPTNVSHRHTFFEACWVGAHGAGLFRSEGADYALAPATFFLARPGALHQIINTGPCDMELYWVSFALPRVGHGTTGDLLRAFERSPMIISKAQETLGAIWYALRAATQHPTGTQESDALVFQHLAQALLVHIAQIGANVPVAPIANESSTLSSPLARMGTQYVHDNLDRPLAPDEIARHLGVSRRQLTRLFSAHTGLPPMLYIERSRLDRARSLLRVGHKSVKEVAVDVGYPDVHHFTRSFTRVVGTSPAQYRAKGSPHEAQFGPHIQKPGSLV